VKLKFNQPARKQKHKKKQEKKENVEKSISLRKGKKKCLHVTDELVGLFFENTKNKYMKVFVVARKFNEEIYELK
jgi:hypothetical protein